MLRVGIISNPYAKINKNKPEYNTRLWYSLGQHGLMHVTHSPEELNQTCEEFMHRKINVIGIVGGDGSMSLVLSAILKSYGATQLPKILLLRGGTINFLAANLGIHTEALLCLKDFITCIEKKQSLFEVPVATLKVNGRTGFIFANATASNFLEEYYKNKTNSFAAVLQIGKHILDGLFQGKINGKYRLIVKPLAMQIEAYPTSLWNNKTHNNNELLDYSIVFASSLPKLPFGIHLFKKVHLGEEMLELYAVAESGSKLIKNALKIFITGEADANARIASVNFDRVILHCNQSKGYSLDGDLISDTSEKIVIERGEIFTFCSPYTIPCVRKHKFH